VHYIRVPYVFLNHDLYFETLQKHCSSFPTEDPLIQMQIVSKNIEARSFPREKLYRTAFKCNILVYLTALSRLHKLHDVE
jgi:hypothetical protein